jgi:hypothetical protein
LRSAAAVFGGVLLAAGSAACSGTVAPLVTATGGAAAAVGTTSCAGTGVDSDGDGLDDRCELSLARAFAPALTVTPGQCLAAEGLPPGGYFYGAEPVPDGVRIVYLPAYFQDCGLAGAKCRLPGVSCAGHAGDSEFIAVDVAPGDDGGWSVAGVFLSAHCFGRWARGCRWYRAHGLDAFSWTGAPLRSAPIVWVSEGRNANYPSRLACDRGHRYLDTCDRNSVRAAFPISTDRDIGSRSAPIRGRPTQPGCVEGSELADPRARPEAVECFWSDAPFRGWQLQGAGSTAYLVYLERIAAF